MYSQKVVVHKIHRQSRLEVVSLSCVVTPRSWPDLLAVRPTSATINTSFSERENLALVQHNRRLVRRIKACSTELPWLEKQLWLSLAYTHVVLPHHSLGQEMPMGDPTRPATHFKDTTGRGCNLTRLLLHVQCGLLMQAPWANRTTSRLRAAVVLNYYTPCLQKQGMTNIHEYCTNVSC
jgi:hypothetical protein